MADAALPRAQYEMQCRAHSAAGPLATTSPFSPFAALAALAVLTALRLAVAALTPLVPDEAYYWVWSRVLQPGYLDHPPMVALWIRLGTLFAGQTPLGVRLLGPLAAAVGSVMLARAAADFFPERPGIGLLAALLLNASLMFGAGSVIMTPDTPLLLFWTLGLFAMARLFATGDGQWWLLAGLAAGLALDSKYTGLLFIIAVGIWLCAAGAGRSWLRRPEPWLGLAIALVVFAPVVAWNAAHHWVSFLKQGGRVGAWRPADALRFEAELLAGQAALFTPIVFVLAVVGSWRLALRAWRDKGPPVVLLSLLTLVPAAVFVQHALGDRVQGNWPAVLYPSAAIAAATLAVRPWVRLRLQGALLGLAIQAVAAPFPLPPRLDPTLRQLGGWNELAAAVAATARRDGAGFIATENYGEAAELAFLQSAPAPVVAVAPRWVFFRLPSAGPIIAGRSGLLLRRSGLREPPDPLRWTVLAPPVGMVRARWGVPAEAFLLYRVRARAEVPGAILPER
jgi:Dolichyl-phosphate-mannose-protein mannosyltransferase